jgi:hypothetical protein
MRPDSMSVSRLSPLLLPTEIAIDIRAPQMISEDLERAAQLAAAADTRPYSDRRLRASVNADATASRQLPLAPLGYSVGRGNCHAASLRAARGPRAAERQSRWGDAATGQIGHFSQLNREACSSRHELTCGDSGLRTLSLSAALASSTRFVEGTGAHLPRFVPGEAKGGFATGAQQGRASILLSQICSIVRCALGVSVTISSRANARHVRALAIARARRAP